MKEQADARAQLVAPKFRLDVRNKAIAQALEQEDEEVKAEIRRKHEELKRERAEGMKTLQSVFNLGNSTRERTPEECLRSVEQSNVSLRILTFAIGL